jgi:hypothetical protein
MSFYLYSPGTIGIEKLPYLDRISGVYALDLEEKNHHNKCKGSVP